MHLLLSRVTDWFWSSNSKTGFVNCNYWNYPYICDGNIRSQGNYYNYQRNYNSLVWLLLFMKIFAFVIHEQMSFKQKKKQWLYKLSPGLKNTFDFAM